MTKVYIVFYMNRTYGPQFIEVYKDKKEAQHFIDSMYKSSEYYYVERLVK